jgi:hypothetical protein
MFTRRANLTDARGAQKVALDLLFEFAVDRESLELRLVLEPVIK